MIYPEAEIRRAVGSYIVPYVRRTRTRTNKRFVRYLLSITLRRLHAGRIKGLNGGLVLDLCGGGEG